MSGSHDAMGLQWDRSYFRHQRAQGWCPSFTSIAMIKCLNKEASYERND